MVWLESHEDNHELETIVERVTTRFRPTRILLYGSFAYGEPTEESDFDLLVVLPTPPPQRQGWDISRELSLRRDLQLMFLSDEEFEETKDVVGGLAYPAHHWGKVLHAQDA